MYGEGKYAARLKKKVYKGIPVLFIPGNQGSSKQGITTNNRNLKYYKRYVVRYKLSSLLVS